MKNIIKTIALIAAIATLLCTCGIAEEALFSEAAVAVAETVEAEEIIEKAVETPEETVSIAVEEAVIEEIPSIEEETAVGEAVEEELDEETVEEAIAGEPAEETVEAAEEAVAEPTAEAVEEVAETVTFEGEVEIRLVNDEVYYGDEVTLEAVVSNPSGAAYSLQWQVDNGSGWEDLSGETDSDYVFVVTEENAGYAYRVVVIG